MDVFESLAIDGKPITRIRRPVEGKPDPLDGYVDATMMCQAAGKKWNDFFRLKDTTAFLNELSTVTRIPAALLLHSKSSGPYEERGTWVHPEVAMDLAKWCSPQFRVHVNRLIVRFQTGDLTLIPQLLQNHDAVNGTTSRALVQTLDAQAVALCQERAKAIEATKECSRAICARGLPASFHAIKNNAVNQAAKGFSCTTNQYKKENGIKASESLREYFARPSQAMVHAMETALETKLSQGGDDDALEVLKRIKRKIEDLCAESGIHKVPLLKEPVKKQMKVASIAAPPAPAAGAPMPQCITNYFAKVDTVNMTSN